jgi:hypothetical protein
MKKNCENNNDAVKEIVSRLEDGVKNLFDSEAYKNFLEVMAKFYNYSANNCLLIALQCPTASYVAGYSAWQTKFKRQVRKGEKAIKILAPCPHKFVKEVENEDGSKEEREICYTTFRTANVFDVSQTEGEDLPSICKEVGDEVENFEELFGKLEKVSPVKISFEDIQTGANGYFSTADKKIVVKAGMPQGQTLKTTVHEIAHAILHDKDSGEEKGADRKTKEVQAESVAYTVCNFLGLDTSEYSFGYVAGWSTGKEVKELQNSLEVIRKTASVIIGALA